ncbi:MAG: hypothetical protein ACK58T_33490, partial [Phycisphaerae bacterium]
MAQEILVERLFEALVNGDRPAARRIVEESVDGGAGPARVLTTLFWPTPELIDRKHRADALPPISTRVSRRL